MLAGHSCHGTDNFYSRPCGRGDISDIKVASIDHLFLLTPLREGRRGLPVIAPTKLPFLLTPLREGRQYHNESCYTFFVFLLTPLREGRPQRNSRAEALHNFYSRPCGRGDRCSRRAWTAAGTFLLTPLREGRPDRLSHKKSRNLFLLTPLREGRQQFSTSPS